MRELLAITNALADQSRVSTLLALRHGRLCVCRIVELLQLAPSTVSKHLSILWQAGLVESRKTGRWVYYTIRAAVVLWNGFLELSGMTHALMRIPSGSRPS
jgi:DNA-binding transcriptional ArsR family regulator